MLRLKELVISHRANLSGPNSASHGENHPSSIEAAIEAGWRVEVDIWWNDGFWLGHDAPAYALANLTLLESPRIWWHCKNIEAFHSLLQRHAAICFFHQEDHCTLTSNGYIWTYPGQGPLYKDLSIAVLPEQARISIERAAGVCTDYPSMFFK